MLGPDVFLLMALTGIKGRKAESDEAEGNVRLTNYCESANFEMEPKARKLQRTGSGLSIEPNPFEATVIALSTSILDYEISHLFQYLVFGASVEYDQSRKVFSMTVLRSTRLEEEDFEPVGALFKKAKSHIIQINAATTKEYNDAQGQPNMLLKYLQNIATVGDAWA